MKNGILNPHSYGFYVKDHKDPDGIIAVSGEEKIKANFILCIPIEEFLKRDRVIFEVRRIPKDSQKKQEA